MNQLYNQVSGHIVGYIGFITNYTPNYLIVVIVWIMCTGNNISISKSL